MCVAAWQAPPTPPLITLLIKLFAILCECVKLINSAELRAPKRLPPSWCQCLMHSEANLNSKLNFALFPTPPPFTSWLPINVEEAASNCKFINYLIRSRTGYTHTHTHRQALPLHSLLQASRFNQLTAGPICIWLSSGSFVGVAR